MTDFRGHKQKNSTRYDRVSLSSERFGLITVSAYDGVERSGGWADVPPDVARKIAAELIRLADQIDAEAKATA